MSGTLVVRLGAMGDVIHTLPAVASLGEATWVIHPKWSALLEGNPHVKRIIPFDRRNWASVRTAWHALRALEFDRAVDFQGLIQSALITRATRAKEHAGYAQPRERQATWLYSRRIEVRSRHIVDRHLDLAVACGAPTRRVVFPLPPGRPEGELPDDYVLASPLAGWKSKQWPIEYYSELARRLPLVVNGAPQARSELEQIRGARIHLSGIEGLIDATRRARAVIGVDSGPMHIAAALGRPGVAIFGPTDPERNGPYGGTLRVLRAPDATTTYKRGAEYSAAMIAIRPEMVLEALA